MAYYSYYQNSQPTWGTQQYQSIPPPIPQYQPQPSWHGGDYYRAHSDSLDSTLFDYVRSKARNFFSGSSVERSEAHHLWKRVYGGLVDPSTLLPREIGAAAGYETTRFWEHHKAIYFQPLSDDRDREKEALIGLAAAEAAKLWAYTQRPRDKYGRMEASEVAAATASRIFDQDYNTPYESYDRSPRRRRRSISSTRYVSRSNALDDAFYDDDDDLVTGTYLDSRPHRSRSQRRYSQSGRPRSSSRYRSPSPVSFRRRSPSPVPYVVAGSGVGMTSLAVNYPSTSYDPMLGAGIPGTYYPDAGALQGSSPTGYSYQQLNPNPGYAVAGGSVYMNRGYAGSSVGLPPPPGGQYLTAQDTTRSYGHHRARSTGAYGATRPTFGY